MKMTQVKFFIEIDCQTLEDKINEWFIKNPGIEVKDIQFKRDIMNRILLVYEFEPEEETIC